MRLLTNVPHLRITRRQGAVVYSRGVHVHFPRRLGAAAPVLAAELPCGDGVPAKGTGEGGQAVNHLDGVMSHSFKCSRLSEMNPEPTSLRVESASTIWLT